MITLALALLFTGPGRASPPVVRPPEPVWRGAPPSSLAFEIDGRRYRMPIPAGYCTARSLPSIYTDDVVGENGLILSKLAFVFLCDTIGKGANDQDFIYLKYIKNYRPKFADRAEFIRANATNLSSPEYMKQRESREFVDAVERKTEQDTGAKVEADLSRVALGHDDICIYTGSRMTIVATASKEAATILAVSCTTMINGRVVTADIASQADRGLDFDALLRRLKKAVETIEPEEA